MSADSFDQELVTAFLTAVKGRSLTEIDDAVPGVTKNDVSRWRKGSYVRVSEAKRRAMVRFLATRDDRTGASITDMVGPLLTISRAAAELAEIVGRGDAATPRDRATEAEIERRLRAIAGLATPEKSA